MLEIPRSARLVAWGNAALCGRTSLDEAAERILGSDRPHRVHDLPGEDRPVSLPMALGRLRALGVSGLRLVLPAPGDPAGLPGPASFNLQALVAGEAVLAEGSVAFGLLPEVAADHVGWRVHRVTRAAALAAPSLSDAERELLEAVRAATDELVRLDVARWRPEIADGIARVRDGAGEAQGLAPGYPPRAHRVLALAQRVGAIAALAAQDPGAAVSAREVARRSAALTPLARASRRAIAAACNATAQPAR